MRKLTIVIILITAILIFPIAAQTVWSGTTEIISLSSDREQANDWSGSASISADGRFVEFSGAADNLVLIDTNDVADTFVHYRFPESHCDGNLVTILGTEGHDIIEGTAGPDVIHGLGRPGCYRWQGRW